MCDNALGNDEQLTWETPTVRYTLGHIIDGPNHCINLCLDLKMFLFQGLLTGQISCTPLTLCFCMLSSVLAMYMMI